MEAGCHDPDKRAHGQHTRALEGENGEGVHFRCAPRKFALVVSSSDMAGERSVGVKGWP